MIWEVQWNQSDDGYYLLITNNGLTRPSSGSSNNNWYNNNTSMFCCKCNSYQFQSRDTICLYYVKLICYWKWETFSCPSGTCREGHEQPVSLSSPSLLVIPNHPSNIIKNLNPPGGKILKINLCLLYLTKILWCNHIWPYTLPFNSA